jgi:lysyl-tRNA synthetase class 2
VSAPDEEAGRGDEIFQIRLEKVARLRAAGINPYPTEYPRTHLAQDIVSRFDSLEGRTVSVAGRIVGAKRDTGKIGFAHVLDRSGRIQVVFALDALGQEGFDYFRRVLDGGDFVGVRGEVIRTRRGEISVQAREVRLLAKSLHNLPEKWRGLTDVEKRFRQRYLDLISNPEVRDIFLARSHIVSAVRRFLDERGFVEVETPVLQPIPGGGAARPFVTESWALDQRLYLRIALELYLKRCVIGGIEAVYEIGKNFRNEGISFKHHPEFTMLELYQAYANYADMMRLTEEMVCHLAMLVHGSSTGAPFGDHEIDFATPWKRLQLREAIAEYAGVDYVRHPDRDSLAEAARGAGLAVQPDWNRGKIMDELLTAFVEPRLIQPTFLVDYPVDFPGSTLAKRKPDQPDEVERFEAFAGGMEIANAFSELNDPLDQRERFEEQVRLRQKGDEEAHPMDEAFLEALEYGMPPTAGLGVGIDRVAMLLTNRTSVREVILFPQLRHLE